jgi:hypothetical protein
VAAFSIKSSNFPPRVNIRPPREAFSS